MQYLSTCSSTSPTCVKAVTTARMYNRPQNPHPEWKPSIPFAPVTMKNGKSVLPAHFNCLKFD